MDHDEQRDHAEEQHNRWLMHGGDDDPTTGAGLADVIERLATRLYGEPEPDRYTEPTDRPASPERLANLARLSDHADEPETTGTLTVEEARHAVADVAAPSWHEKGRDCARTDEVLDNYRRRAIAAERAAIEAEPADPERCGPCTRAERHEWERHPDADLVLRDAYRCAACFKFQWHDTEPADPGTPPAPAGHCDRCGAPPADFRPACPADGAERPCADRYWPAPPLPVGHGTTATLYQLADLLAAMAEDPTVPVTARVAYGISAELVSAEADERSRTDLADLPG